MKLSKFKHILILLLLLYPFHLLAQSTISNVRAMQEGRNVVLLYDLSKDTQIKQVKIEVDGISRIIPSSCLGGDVRKKVQHGKNRRIVYNVLEDYTNGLRSDNVYFIIEDNSSPQHNGHEYIDLGLSVKWATCNVGANTPKECGNYYAWGETNNKKFYSWNTYKWCKLNANNLTRYCTLRENGTIDYKTQLELSDDVANVLWGGNWRIPTISEWDELCTQCTWTWATLNGINGYKVTSKVNGNSIFLPATGFYSENSSGYINEVGYYWSNSISPLRPAAGKIIEFGIDNIEQKNSARFFGHSVRPVYP